MSNQRITVRFLKAIPLHLKAIAGKANVFELERPISVSKAELLDKLRQLVELPAFLLRCFPNLISIYQLKWDKNRRPTETELRIEVDLRDWFDSWQSVISYGGASFDLHTDKEILTETNDSEAQPHANRL